MNTKAIIPLVIGLGIAGLGGKLGLDYIRKANANVPKTVKLWTPIDQIPRGTAIAKDMLKPVDFPISAAPKDAIADVDKLVGRVPHTGAPAGVPVLESMLRPPGAPSGILVPEGMRAVAVKIDESSGVDYHLQPGCRVDVVGFFTIRKNNKNETIARTLLENVEVAAVGAQVALSPAHEETDKGKSSRKTEQARAVTLLVSPNDVPALHLAEQKGKIKLSMRSNGEAAPDAFAHGTVSENEVLGLESPDEASEKESWAGGLSKWVQGFMRDAEPEPSEEPAPPPAVVEPPAPPVPSWAWVMVVYNGDDRRVLGWDSMQSFQPSDLTTEGPNLFQDPPSGPPLPPQIRRPELPLPPGSGPTKAPEDEDPQPEPEPEELFG